MITSSSSLVAEVDPIESSRPITVNEEPAMDTDCPTGSRPENNSEAVSGPSTITERELATSASLMNRPSVSVRLRTFNQDGLVPYTGEVQVVLPAVRFCEPPDTAATAATSGATSLEVSVAASEVVSVVAEPRPPRKPVEVVDEPGDT